MVVKCGSAVTGHYTHPRVMITLWCGSNVMTYMKSWSFGCYTGVIMLLRWISRGSHTLAYYRNCAKSTCTVSHICHSRHRTRHSARYMCMFCTFRWGYDIRTISQETSMCVQSFLLSNCSSIVHFSIAACLSPSSPPAPSCFLLMHGMSALIWSVFVKVMVIKFHWFLGD